MKIKNLLKYVGLLSVLFFFVFSCKKSDDGPDSDTSAAADYALAEGTFNDVLNITDRAMARINDSVLGSYLTVAGSNEKSILANSCVHITFDSLNTADLDTILINFGNTDCLGLDGRNRKGEIIVTYTHRYNDSGSVHNISFNNYFVNDNKVLGTKTVVNNGYNAFGNLVYTITDNGSVQKPNNGGTISWTANRTREWILGANTSTWTDDVYSITGSASGSTSDSKAFSMSITTPLKLELNCHHLVSGVAQVTPTSLPVRTVNYGTGACDDQATVTINGNIYPIILH